MGDDPLGILTPKTKKVVTTSDDPLGILKKKDGTSNGSTISDPSTSQSSGSELTGLSKPFPAKQTYTPNIFPSYKDAPDTIPIEPINVANFNKKFEDVTGYKDFSLSEPVKPTGLRGLLSDETFEKRKENFEQKKFKTYSKEKEKIDEVSKKIYFGDIKAEELSQLQQNPFSKNIANNIIKEYVPEILEVQDGNPATIELAAKRIKEKNRINFVNAESENIKQLDNNVINTITELKLPTTERAGTYTEYINELRDELALDDFTNNDKISNTISKVKEIQRLEQEYYLGDESKKTSREKTQGLLDALTNRLYYNVSRKGVSPTLNWLDDKIGQSVISKLIASDRGNDLPDKLDKDKIKLNQFKLGLTAIEKQDPILFKNITGAIANEKKIADTDFNNIANIGQRIDNTARFRGGAYNPELIDSETDFDYTTFGQKKSIAAAEIGEWFKSNGIKNLNEFSPQQIRKAATELGINNKEIINSLIFDEKLGFYDAIPKSGWVDDIKSGIMQPLVGINSTLNTWNESPAQTYLRSKSLDGTFGAAKVPDSQGQYSEILPSERGRFSSDMFRGLGQFIPQVLLTKGVGAGLKGATALAGIPTTINQAKNIADYGGTFISTFLQSYGQSYEESLQKTGDPDTSSLIGTIDGVSSAAFELLLPDVKIADRALGGLKQGLSEGLVALAKKGGNPAELATKARPFVKKFFQGVTNTIVQENLEELGTQYVDFVTESIFDPASARDRNVNKELWDTFKSTTAAMLLPSILGASGGSFTKDFTTKSLHSAAINFDSYKESLQKSLDKEYISQNDFNKSLQALSTHRESIANTPEINSVGKELSHEKRLDYALEDTKIKYYKEQEKKSAGNVAKQMWNDKIKESEEIQEGILMPKATDPYVIRPKENIQRQIIEIAPQENVPTEKTKGVAIILPENNKRDNVIIGIGGDKSAAKIESAIIEINGKTYEGKNHAEAILAAQADGQDISQVDRQASGKFKLSDGTVIDRTEAKARFGQDRSELLIPQDEAANQANKDYRKITGKTEPLTKQENNAIESIPERTPEQIKDLTREKVDAAKRRAIELGIDPKKLIEKAVKNIVNDLPDANDKAFLAKSIIDNLLKEPDTIDLPTSQQTGNSDSDNLLIKESSIDRGIRETEEAAQANEVAKAQIDVLIQSVKPELKEFSQQLKDWHLGEGKKPELDTQDKKDIFYITKLMYSGWSPKDINEQLKQHIKAANFYDNRSTTPAEFISKLLEPTNKQIELPQSDNNQKTGKEQTGNSVEVQPEVLSEKDFDKKYKGQHKDLRAISEEEANTKFKSMQEEGFKEGIGANALPIQRGGSSSVISQRYGNKKGDIVYLVPKEFIKDTPNGLKVKEGYKPSENERVKIEYDGQPTYEAYKNQISKKNIEPKTETGDVKQSTNTGNENKVDEKQTEVKEEKKQSKLLDLADRIEKEGFLPSWAKADLPEGTQLQGFNFNKAVADAIRLVDAALKKGVEISKAIEEGFNSIRQHYKENNAKIKDEEKLKSDFEKFINDNFKSEIGITHADTKDIRIEQGLGEYEKTPETVEQWNKQADERIENGELPALIKRLENGGGVVDGTEQTMLGKYIAAINDKASKNPSNENLAELKKALLLNEVVGSKQFGQVGRARQETFVPDETLAKWMVDKMESLGVEELTQEQKADVTEKFSNYEAALKIESEKRAEAEEQISKLKAELALKTEFEKRKTVRSKNTKSLKEERQEIITSIKDKLRKARGETNVTVVPYAKELYTIAPDVAKLVRNLVEEGAVKLESIVDTIYTNLKDEIDGITKKDVSDLIAGEYNEKRKTKSELEVRLKDIKDEAALINKLEALENGDIPKEPKKVIERNKKIKELRKKIKDFKKENPDPTAQVRALKNKNEKEYTQIVKDLANKNFETKKQTPIDYNAALKKVDPKLWKETMDAIAKRDEAKHLWELEKQRDEFKKRGWGRKVLDFGSKLIATSKSIKAGIDDSITGIQLGLAIMANPRAGVKAKWQAILDTNAKRFKRQLVALHESPRWNLIQESGLDITEPKSMHQNLAEELYSGNLLDRNFTVKGKRINLWTYTGGIFERLFTSMGNNMRLNLFLARTEQIENSGKTFETHPQEFKDAARIINEMTGRGKMNQVLQTANPIITPIIWAPRLISSSLNLLGLSDITLSAVKKGFYQNLTPSQRRYALGQMGRGIGVGIAIMATAAMNGWDVDKDPQSATFGTIGKGTRRYNVFGRFSGVVKTIAQVLTGTKKTKFGEQDLDNPKYGGKTGGSVLGGFLRGKMTPFAGLIFDYKLNAKKNYFTRESVNIQGLPDALLTPISVADMKKGLEQDGSWSLLTRFLPAFEGINVTDERDFKSIPPETITHNGDEVKLTDSQSKELDNLINDTKNEYKENLLETDEYKSATKEEKIEFEKNANTLANKDAKKVFKENYSDQFEEKSSEEKSEEAAKTKELNKLIRGQ